MSKMKLYGKVPYEVRREDEGYLSVEESTEEKPNIVKETCKKLGLTQKELAERLDVPQSTVSGWAKNDIPKMTQFALELLIKNKDLEDKLNIFKQAHKIASEL